MLSDYIHKSKNNDILVRLKHCVENDNTFSSQPIVDLFVLCASGNYLHVVELLLRANKNLLEASNAHGLTALMIASLNGRSESVALLLRSGAALENCGQRSENKTPLYYAILRNSGRVVEQLVAAGAVLHKRFLGIASIAQVASVVRPLVLGGIDCVPLLCEPSVHSRSRVFIVETMLAMIPGMHIERLVSTCAGIARFNLPVLLVLHICDALFASTLSRAVHWRVAKQIKETQ